MFTTYAVFGDMYSRLYDLLYLQLDIIWFTTWIEFTILRGLLGHHGIISLRGQPNWGQHTDRSIFN